MFNIGAGEMIVIALILLMAVGPEQLPGLIRRVGRTVSEVKGMTEGLRSEFMSGLEEIERATDPEAWAAGGNQPTKVKPPKTSTTNPFSDNATAASAAVAAGAAADSDSDPEDTADVQDTVDPEDTVDSEDTVDAQDTAGAEDTVDAEDSDPVDVSGHVDGDSPGDSDGAGDTNEKGDAAHAFPDATSAAEATNAAEAEAPLDDPDGDKTPAVADPSVDAWVADAPDEGETSEMGEQE